MKIALTLTALALSLTPAMAYSGCADKAKTETAASCMPGTTWDAATATCTATPSS
ncbi:MAG: hypothetical protein MUE52_07995 [Tabrizicola sp.]|jgi:hypothetical protein|nr:hypothetical protein [Tabrizicola sp.]